MKKYLLFCVISTVTFNCDGQRPSLLGGLLSGAHEIGHKVHDALQGLAHGNSHLNFQGNVNGAHLHRPGHQNPPGYTIGGHKPEQPTETIIVVVQEEPQQNTYGSYGQGPQSNYGVRPGGPYNNNKPNFLNKPGYNGYNSNYNLNVQWSANHQRPGYGQFPQGNNNNGNNNNGNINPNQNYGNYNGNTGNLVPNYDTGNTNPNNQNGGNVIPNNYGNTNLNHGNTNPNNQNGGNVIPNNYGNTNLNHGNTNPNHYGNIPSQPPFAEPNHKEPENQNNPTNGIPINKPTGNNNYGTIYDSSNENEDKKPNIEINDNHKDQTTKKPEDHDKPLFVPLNPNQYTYGGDKIEINAPKRETNESQKKPVEDEDSESYPIDIRFGDK